MIDQLNNDQDFRPPKNLKIVGFKNLTRAINHACANDANDARRHSVTSVKRWVRSGLIHQPTELGAGSRGAVWDWPPVLRDLENLVLAYRIAKDSRHERRGGTTLKEIVDLRDSIVARRSSDFLVSNDVVLLPKRLPTMGEMAASAANYSHGE